MAQGLQTWRRLNDTISILFARGLHRSLEGNQHTPTFIVELRKWIFSRVYASDISFAVFLGRPPRMSHRHCILHAPLDVDRSAYELSEDAWNEQLQQLDCTGWNTRGQVRAHAVLRWSMTTSKIREQTLDILLGPQITGEDQLVRQVKHQYHKISLADVDKEDCGWKLKMRGIRCHPFSLLQLVKYGVQSDPATTLTRCT